MASDADGSADVAEEVVAAAEDESAGVAEEVVASDADGSADVAEVVVAAAEDESALVAEEVVTADEDESADVADAPVTAAPVAAVVRGPSGEVTGYRGHGRDELVEDFRLACVSRALDDREIALQKQSRVFFQISGAGHEALLLALARSLRPGYDWFFPYYRDQALVLGLGVTPREILLQAVGSAEDPTSGGRQMPCHWGSKRLNIVTQSSPTGSQCLPAVGCAEASRYIAAARPARHATAYGDELTYVSLGEGATSEGEFWESLNTACRLHLPVLYVVADNGYAISVRASDQAPAPISELVRGFRGLAVYKVDGTRLLRHPRRRRHRHRPTSGRAPARGSSTRPCTRPYSHSSARHPGKYRSSDELAEEALHDPIERLEDELVAAGVLSAAEAAEIRDEARALVAEIGQEVLGARRPDPATVTDHVLALPEPRPPSPDRPAAAEGAELLGMGEAIRRTLYEQMAADERIRVFGEDVADAERGHLVRRRGQGRGVRHHARPPARVRHRALLQHPAGRGEHHRPRRSGRRCEG